MGCERDNIRCLLERMTKSIADACVPGQARSVRCLDPVRIGKTLEGGRLERITTALANSLEKRGAFPVIGVFRELEAGVQAHELPLTDRLAADDPEWRRQARTGFGT